jgi:hypothetical protein
MPIIVQLGNPTPVQIIGADRRQLGFESMTEVHVPDATPLMTALGEVTHISLWTAHSDDKTPSWVACSDDTFGKMLASHWGIELRPLKGVTGDAN